MALVPYNGNLYSTSYEDSVCNRKKLSILCESLSMTGKIRVDLLAVNGNSFNRFVEIEVNDKYKVLSVNVIKYVDIEIKKESLHFYNKNQWAVTNSVLTPFLRTCIKMNRMF